MNRFVLFIGLIFTGILSSCTDKKKVVGFMLPHMNNIRYVLEKEEFTRSINEFGGEVLFTNSNNDEKIQLQQADSLFDAGIKILVLDPVNRFTAAQIVRKAHDRNIKVISYDRLIANIDVDAYISFDAEMAGSQMVSAVLKEKDEGSYIILGGDKSDINAIRIAKGINTVLDHSLKSNKVKIAYNVFIEMWDEAEAKNEISRYLNITSSCPQAIIAANDAMANGAIMALKEYEYEGKVLVASIDGGLLACRNILAGHQFSAVYKPVKKLAELAANLSIKMLNNDNTKDILTTTLNNDYADIPSCLLETIPLNASNIKSTVIADGMVSEKELNN